MTTIHTANDHAPDANPGAPELQYLAAELRDLRNTLEVARRDHGRMQSALTRACLREEEARRETESLRRNGAELVAALDREQQRRGLAEGVLLDTGPILADMEAQLHLAGRTLIAEVARHLRAGKPLHRHDDDMQSNSAAELLTFALDVHSEVQTELETARTVAAGLVFLACDHLFPAAKAFAVAELEWAVTQRVAAARESLGS